MDRKGFKNRMKQYKKAREENPGLKYWEWKATPKYDEGTAFARDFSTEENPIYYKEETAKEKYIRAHNALLKAGGWSNRRRDEIADTYTIPYIPEKEIRLTTGRYNTGKISTNLLDSIHASAIRTGVPVDIALGLAGRESTLGIGRGFKKGNPISGTNLMSNWQQIQVGTFVKSKIDKYNAIREKIINREPVSDEEYNYAADFIFDDIHEGERMKPLTENPIDNALRYYLSGKYNPGDKRHALMVEEDARILMSDPAILKWAKAKGIKYAEGGEVELNPLEVLERSRPKVAGIPINDKPLSGTDPIGELYLDYVSGKGVYKTIKGMKAGFDRKSLKSAYDYYHNDLRFPRKMAYDTAKARPYIVEDIDNLLNKLIELLKWN